MRVAVGGVGGGGWTATPVRYSSMAPVSSTAVLVAVLVALCVLLCCLVCEVGVQYIISCVIISDFLPKNVILSFLVTNIYEYQYICIYFSS